MTTKEQVIEEINALSDEEVREVADYLARLKGRARGGPPAASDEARLAALYAEFAEEDKRLADLDPTRGSGQAGTRPVLIFQNDAVNKFTTTTLTVPLTTNPRRASLPSCAQIPRAKADCGVTRLRSAIS